MAIRRPENGLSWPILLNARRPQPGKAVVVDRLLPGEKLLDGQGITGTGLLKTKESTANRGYHLGFAPYYPAFSVARRKVCKRQRATIWADYILYARPTLFGHSTLTLTPVPS